MQCNALDEVAQIEPHLLRFPLVEVDQIFYEADVNEKAFNALLICLMQRAQA